MREAYKIFNILSEPQTTYRLIIITIHNNIQTTYTKSSKISLFLIMEVQP